MEVFAIKKEKHNKEAREYIFRRYITKNGVRIYPKNGKAFKIPLK